MVDFAKHMKKTGKSRTDFTENDVREPPGTSFVPMLVHELKSDLRVFADVLLDNKRHETRKNDRVLGFRTGDFLRLGEWRTDGGEGRYTGREVLVVVTYLARVEGTGEFAEFDTVMSFVPLAFASSRTSGWVPWAMRGTWTRQGL